MGDISSYATRTTVAGTDRFFLATGTSPEINSATLELVAPTVTDGTTTLTGVGTIILDGGSVSGTSAGTSALGTATLTVTGGFTRPRLSSFGTFGNQSGLTISEPYGASGPILLMSTGSTQSVQLCGITLDPSALADTEFMFTARFTPNIFTLSNDYRSVGCGFVGTNGQLLTFSAQKNLYALDVWTNSNTYSYTVNSAPPFNYGSGDVWLRFYYQASNTSYPLTLLQSYDGVGWHVVDYGIAIPSGFWPPVAAEFHVNPNGASGAYAQTTGSLNHWDIQAGTGSSLNPLAPVNPL